MNALLKSIHKDLGVTPTHLAANKLAPCEEPSLLELEVVEIDYEGKPFILINDAANAWRDMRQAAMADNVIIQPFSGFRSYLYQRQLIVKKLARGQSLEEIFTETAIPGFSEHHTGRAVDITTDSYNKLEEDFEKTQAYAWLLKNADQFGFTLSYPRNNDKGIIYEPWHWCYNG